MKVVKPGTDIVLVGGIQAKIESVVIESKMNVSYVVIWVVGTEIYRMTIPEMMILGKQKEMEIGFKV